MHIIDCAVQIKFCTVIDRCPHAIFSSAIMIFFYYGSYTYSCFLLFFFGGGEGGIYVPTNQGHTST